MKKLTPEEIRTKFEQYKQEFDKQYKLVWQYIKEYQESRKLVWNTILQFNSILIAVFSIIITLNTNINKVHFPIFYIISFLPIIMIISIILNKQRQAFYNRRYSLLKLLEMGPIERLEKLLTGKKPNNDKDQYGNSYAPESKVISIYEILSIIFSIIAFLYFIVLILVNTTN